MTQPEEALPREPLLIRIHRTLGPLAGGLILDFVDLATFGPVGLAGGFLLGGAAAWWISSIYELSLRKRLLLAVLAMVYVGTPLTGIIPLATLLSASARFKEHTTRAVEAFSAIEGAGARANEVRALGAPSETDRTPGADEADA